jgi:hypothetical protein
MIDLKEKLEFFVFDISKCGTIEKVREAIKFPKGYGYISVRENKNEDGEVYYYADSYTFFKGFAFSESAFNGGDFGESVVVGVLKECKTIVFLESFYSKNLTGDANFFLHDTLDCKTLDDFEKALALPEEVDQYEIHPYKEHFVARSYSTTASVFLRQDRDRFVLTVICSKTRDIIASDAAEARALVK